MKRIYIAFFISLAGIRAAWRDEASFREECIAAIVLIPLAFYLTDVPLERALLIASVLFVMVVELINSAIEATIDRISDERHLLSKKAKDCGSAAVLLALILAAVIWLGVLV